jgi:short-chain fatty acids transporter
LARAQSGAESAVALIGFSFLQFAVHLPMVLFLLWLLGLSLTYHSPVMPAPT